MYISTLIIYFSFERLHINIIIRNIHFQFRLDVLKAIPITIFIIKIRLKLIYF